MKTFHGGNWGGKLNFVDKNNVLVGFDYSQSCCESFGYDYLDSDKKEINPEPNEEFLESYYFDETFIEYPHTNKDSWDEGGDVIFKLIKRKNDKKPIYLRLYNHHNGYYSHGFDMSKDKTVIHQGSL